MKKLLLVPMFLACAHAKVQVPEQPETVGNLSSSYHSIAVAPVKTTDEQATDSFVVKEDKKAKEDHPEDVTPDVSSKHDCEFDVHGCN